MSYSRLLILLAILGLSLINICHLHNISLLFLNHASDVVLDDRPWLPGIKFVSLVLRVQGLGLGFEGPGLKDFGLDYNTVYHKYSCQLEGLPLTIMFIHSHHKLSLKNELLIIILLYTSASPPAFRLLGSKVDTNSST